MALVTIPGILNSLQTGQKLAVVDDGTLTEEDGALLKSLAPVIEVITRAEREEFVLDAISRHPNCQKFRNEYGPALKLLDIPLIAKKDNSRFTYTDSDIIYLKKCTGFFSRDTNTYLKTDAIKLSVKLANVFFKYQWQVPYRFNSGYFSYDMTNYDLDFIDFFVSRPDVRNIPWVIEQTGWALLFGRSGTAYCPSEEEFICRENFSGPEEKTLAIHLIANLKNKVQEWSGPQYVRYETEVNPTFERARNVTLADWAQKSARRLLQSL